MRKLVAFALVGAIALQHQKVEANPAIAAPAAFCLGTGGLGCVLVATTVVGGVVYYVWRRNDGKKAYVRKFDRPGDSGSWEDYVKARDSSDAQRKCKRSNPSGELVDVKYDWSKKWWVCTFR